MLIFILFQYNYDQRKNVEVKKEKKTVPCTMELKKRNKEISIVKSYLQMAATFAFNF